MPLIPEITSSGSHGCSKGKTGGIRECVSLQVKKFTSWQEWEALSPDWERILRDDAGLTIFSTPAWLGAWWHAFGEARQLVAFSFSNARGEVIGLAPLCIEASKNRGLSGVRRLRLVGDGTEDSDNLDLIFRPGHEVACSEALLARLASERGWDVCELNTLNADSHIARAMLACLRERKWPIMLAKRPSSAVPSLIPGKLICTNCHASTRVASSATREDWDVITRFAFSNAQRKKNYCLLWRFFLSCIRSVGNLKGS